MSVNIYESKYNRNLEKGTEVSNNDERKDPPKKAFNTEYETQWKKEYLFLKSSGFSTTYVKTDEYGIKTYKYKKSPELFFALAQFYTQVRYNKEFDKWSNLSSNNNITIDEAKQLVPDIYVPVKE